MQYIRNNTSKEKREKIFNNWYRNTLKSQIPSLIEKWEKIVNVKVSSWGVKLMRTKWGSCNEKTKRIWFNVELAKTHPRCLEYVVVHEMVHLLIRNHNEKFIIYMDKFLPKWKSIKKELNEILFIT